MAGARASRRAKARTRRYQAARPAEAWPALARHAGGLARVHLRALFARDPARFGRLSFALDDLLVDLSKNRITDETLKLLLALARERGVKQATARMFAGERINTTENRAALHAALRNRANRPMLVDGRDVMQAVNDVLARMRRFTDAVLSGAWRGATGKPVAAVVNIGIGGSELGLRMAVEALPKFRTPLAVHFVSNVDGAEIARTLKGLDPETALFVIASKTFTTQETVANAATARAWLVGKLGAAAVARHMVAASANAGAAKAFGIEPANIFESWDWVGGRYSLWSATGLAIALAVGFENFTRLLDGAHAMDEHFRSAPLTRNLPVLLALVGVWNANFQGCAAHAVLPYDQGLWRLPAYLQQAEMESNGKSVGLDGKPVAADTAPAVFGEPGTNGQHAFYQWLHQGTRPVSCDFIAPALSQYPIGRHHAMLLANFLAQTEALMRGHTAKEARAALARQGLAGKALAALAPHTVFPGNRPTTAILFRALDPYALGRLIALYEHKTFVQGVLWGINPFDQWGVELGKELANALLPELEGAGSGRHDSSTAGLLARLRALRGKG